MKKILALLLALVMLLSLCACGKEESEIRGEVSEAEETVENNGAADSAAAKEPDEEPEAEPEAEVEAGVVAGGRYESSFLGIGCELDETWIYYGEEELGGLIGMTADMFEDESYAESVKSADMFYDMYAAANDGTGRSINVLIQNLGLLYGATLSEDEYMSLSTKDIGTQLESAGFSDVSWEKAKVDFAGKERVGIKLSSKIQGIDYFCTQLYIKQGSYMAVVTLASYVEDSSEDLAKFFFPVE